MISKAECLTDLVIRRPRSKRWDGNFILEQKMKYLIDDEIIEIPSGFVTDLASIPRQVWLVVSKYDYGVAEASVLHDYMYKNKKGRFYSDLAMKKIMEDYDVPAWRVDLVFKALRLFGGIFYHKSHL